jgi:putative addiction module antidote
MDAITKVVALGGSLGITIPQEMLAYLKVVVGDTVYLTEFPGGFRITAHDEQLEAAHEIMRENRDVLKRLAE